MDHWSCDVCGRACSRIHKRTASGMEAAVCDDCAGYDYAAYDEDPDPVLTPRAEYLDEQIDPREEIAA